jgi:hypothetical protein
LHHGECLSRLHYAGIRQRCETLAETQVIDGIEQIALAHAVVAEQRVDVLTEIQVGLGDILEVGYM